MKLKEKAFSLLARKNYFTRELKTKLLEKGYPENEIKDLLEELKKGGLLNDQELAERFINTQKEKGYGARWIERKLIEKAGRLSLSISESEEAVRKLVKKRYLKKLPEKRPQVISALLRRGISYELILKVLNTIRERNQ